VGSRCFPLGWSLPVRGAVLVAGPSVFRLLSCFMGTAGDNRVEPQRAGTRPTAIRGSEYRAPVSRSESRRRRASTAHAEVRGRPRDVVTWPAGMSEGGGTQNW